jgi:hypothetical protein
MFNLDGLVDICAKRRYGRLRPIVQCPGTTQQGEAWSRGTRQELRIHLLLISPFIKQLVQCELRDI